MTDRIPLDDLTSDQLDQLYDRLAELEKDADTLAALHAAGVDGWEGYDTALD